MKTNDGGPAFPAHWGDNERGMSVRDYFAIQAPGLSDDVLAETIEKCCPEIGKMPSWDGDPIGNLKWWMLADAKIRFMQADAMLKERAVNP
jgi:hypothetical protein